MPNVAQQPVAPPLYAAFMSYSHAADGKLAPSLQRAIQRLGKPWYRRPTIRVFRDETSLAANPGLWSGIQAALEVCSYCLLMCSPTAAASPWVQKEVEWWLANRPANRLLLVITDGDIAWDPASSDFDWSRTNCIPRSLAHRFTEEPYYIDLRWAHNQDALSLRNVRFRTASLTIAATLHGVPMEELESEDLRQQRHLRTVTVVTALVIVVLSVLTYLSQQSSRSARQSAASATRIADSRRMAAKASELLDSHGDPSQAMLLGVLAWRLSPTQEAEDILNKVASTTSDVTRVLGQHAAGNTWMVGFTVAADGSPLLATNDSSGTVILWRVPGATPAAPPIAVPQGQNGDVLFSRDGSTLLSFNGAIRDSNSLSVTDVRSGASRNFPVSNLPANFTGGNMTHGSASLSPSGRFVAVSGSVPGPTVYTRPSAVVMWDTVSGQLFVRPLPLPNLSVSALAFLDEDRLLFLSPALDPGKEGPFAGIWTRSTNQVQTGPRAAPTSQDDATAGFAAFGRDGSRVAFWYHNDLVVYGRDALNLRQVKLSDYDSMHSYIDTVSLSASNNRVAVETDSHENATVWDLEHGAVLKRLPHATGAFLSMDGRWLAASTAGSTILLYDLNTNGKEAAALKADCTRTSSGDGRCIQQLCAKAEPILRSDATLRQVLGDMEVDRLKRLALDRPCLGEVGD